MFEREIKFIYDFNLNKVKKIGSFLTYSQLLSADLHPAILKYISAEIDYLIFEDRQKMLRDSVFDYSSEKINHYFAQIGEEVKGTKRFSLDYVKKLILHATSFNVNFLVRPNWSLVKFIYDDEEHKTTLEIKQILNYVYYYDYLKDVLISYLNKKKLLSLNNSEFKQLLIKIDKIGIDSYLNDMLETTLNSIAEFLNIGSTSKTKVPVKAVEGFLKERGLIDHVNILAKSLAGEEKYKYEISDLMTILNKVKIHKEEDTEEFEEVHEPVTESIEVKEEIVNEEIVEATEDTEEVKISDEIEIADLGNIAQQEEHVDIIAEEVPVESEISEVSDEDAVVEIEEVTREENTEEEIITEEIATEEELIDTSLKEEPSEEIEEVKIDDEMNVADFDDIAHQEEHVDIVAEEIPGESEIPEMSDEDTVVEAEGDSESFEKELLDDRDLFVAEFGEDFGKKEEQTIVIEDTSENILAEKNDEPEANDIMAPETMEEPEPEINEEIFEDISEEFQIDDEILPNQNNEETTFEDKDVVNFKMDSETEVINENSIKEEIVEEELLDEIIDNSIEDETDEVVMEFDSENQEELNHVLEKDLTENIEEDFEDIIEIKEESFNTDIELAEDNTIVDSKDDLVEQEEEIIDQELNIENHEIEPEKNIETEEEDSKESKNSGFVQPSFFDEKIELEEDSEEYKEVKVDDGDLENYEFDIEEDQENDTQEIIENIDEEVFVHPEEKENEVILPEEEIKVEEETISTGEENSKKEHDEKIDLSDIMENKYMNKIVEKIFSNDMEEFAEVIDELSECSTVNEAQFRLKEYMDDNGISSTSKEALKFLDIISEYFEN